ncbi:MAG: DUF998 domain-containing protein [Candidatus Thorarchaeota archaeon]
MTLDNEKVAGLLLFFGTLQGIFVVLILALVEPGYSFSTNFISDLGDLSASNALIFNLSTIIWGLGILIAGFLLYRASATESIFPNRLFAILIVLCGICTIGVGLAPINSSPSIYPLPLHVIFGDILAGLRVIAMFVSFKIMNPPLSYIQIILGVMAFVLTFLFLTAIDFGLGVGGIQRVSRVVLYAWLFIISTHLMNKS